MIVTVTMNPSIDVSYKIDNFMLDTVNRSSASKTAGGKGLNVTRVLNELSADVLATGVLGGDFGNFIKHKLDNENIHYSFTSIEEETRSSIAILHEGKQTEILEQGPHVSEEEQKAFLKNFDQCLEQANFLTISGSLPKGVSTDFYTKLIAKATDKGIPSILDCSGVVLKETLDGQVKPFLIKPNLDEFQELVKKKITLENTASIKQNLSDPIFSGINCIVISLGADGAICKYQDKFFRVSIPKINAVNPVGSGDATIAGLTFGLSKNKAIEDILKIGITTGILNTLESRTGHIDIHNFQNIFKQIKVTAL